MGSTNKFFSGVDNGLGLDLWWQKKPFDSDPNAFTFQSTRVGTHVKDGDLPIYTSLFRYRDPKTRAIDPVTGDYKYEEGIASKFVISSQTENDDEKANDTTISSIIGYLQSWKSTWVDYADFAYLKDLGVYPSNRLMIARRFASPTPNNIYSINASPIATMVSWMTEEDNFSITYGEKWEEVRESTFTDILNNLGDDLPFGDKGGTTGTETKDGKEVGTSALKGFKAVALGGWTEGLQIEVMKKLGLVDYESNNPPSGNPNLIREAMRRETVSKQYAGSGLSGKFSIKFVVEYEQKYINGVDPTLVYMDIIQKALMFGTSKSTFYFNQSANTKLNNFVNGLVNGDINQMINSLFEFVAALSQALGVITSKAADFIFSVGKALAPLTGNTFDATTQEFTPITDPTQPPTVDFKQVEGAARATIGTVVSKYRIKFFSILQAMTGAPSGYWHVTIGNPKKPFFSCGDLYTTAVTMEFGKILSYNDLPSTIKISFTLESARNLGGQEIMDALNTGQGRSYIQRQRSYVEVPIIENTDKEVSNIDTKDSEIREKKFKDILTENLKSSNPGPGGKPAPAPETPPPAADWNTIKNNFLKEWKDSDVFQFDSPTTTPPTTP
jgi:hypothetical protein